MSDKSEIKKLSKAKMMVIITLLAAACVLLLGLNAYQFLTKDTGSTSSDSIREEIVPVAKMTTYEYNFTQVMDLNDPGNPFEFKNPITSKLFVATVEGTSSIGVNTENLTCEPMSGPGGALETVSVTLPHSEILTMDINPDTLKIYADEGLFNKATKEDLNNLYVQAENEQREKIMSSNLLSKSDERISQLITSQIKAAHGEDVKVSVTFIDSE